MRPIGFSTGALAKSDFRLALSELSQKSVNSIELSALRYPELRPLLEALPNLSLNRYRNISLHAPSQFQGDEEIESARLLRQFVPEAWTIIVHPDAIRTYEIWRAFGNRLAVENMDRRKPIGRTADELAQIFSALPEASFCFDIGHARQFDTTMTEAYRILREFRNRLCQVHVSEVNSASQHDPLSYAAMVAFEQVATLIPEWVPLIIESRLTVQGIDDEITKVIQAFPDIELSQQLSA